MLSPGVTVGPRKGARFLWSLDGKGLHRLEDALLTAGELAVSPSSAVERGSPMPRGRQVSFPSSSFGTLQSAVVPSLLSLGSHLSRGTPWLPDKARPHMSVQGTLPSP